MFAISLGTAFKQKNSKTQNITVTIIGDGGMEEGIVYETLNLDFEIFTYFIHL